MRMMTFLLLSGLSAIADAGDFMSDIAVYPVEFKFVNGQGAPGYPTSLIEIRHIENPKKDKPLFVAGYAREGKIGLVYPKESTNLSTLHQNKEVAKLVEFGRPKLTGVLSELVIWSGGTQLYRQVCADWYRRPDKKFPSVKFTMDTIDLLDLKRSSPGGVKGGEIEEYATAISGRILVDSIEVPYTKTPCRLTIKNVNEMIIDTEYIVIEGKVLGLGAEDAGKLKVRLFMEAWANIGAVVDKLREESIREALAADDIEVDIGDGDGGQKNMSADAGDDNPAPEPKKGKPDPKAKPDPKKK